MSKEKMKYVYFTQPLTEQEHFYFITKFSKFLADWQRDFDDYNELFVDDPIDKELRQKAKKAKTERDNYRDIKRKNNK